MQSSLDSLKKRRDTYQKAATQTGGDTRELDAQIQRLNGQIAELERNVLAMNQALASLGVERGLGEPVYRITTLRCSVMAGLVPAIHASPQAKCRAEPHGCADAPVPGAVHDDSGCRSTLPAGATIGPRRDAAHSRLHLQQKQDLMTGGLAGREAEANAKFQTARTQNQDLQDQQLQLDREIDRNNGRIASAQSDLDRVSAELNAARKRNAVSEADYRRLKSEVDETRSDLASVNMQLDADALPETSMCRPRSARFSNWSERRASWRRPWGMSSRP